MRAILRRSLSAFRRGTAPVPESFAQLSRLSPAGAVRLATDVYEGRCTSQEAAHIAAFATDGYVVFPRAVEPELVDDVRSIARHPGRFVTTDHRRGMTRRLSDVDFDAFESIFDTYVNFESARRVAFHPTIVRFLAHLFGTAPLAIQQLMFQRSNQHAVHQDTSVWAADLVHESNPRTLPEHETRLSVVTHYCPRTTQPFWLRFHRGTLRASSTRAASHT